MNPELSQSYQDMFILGILKGQYVIKLGFLFVVSLPLEGIEMTVSTSRPVCILLQRYWLKLKCSPASSIPKLSCDQCKHQHSPRAPSSMQRPLAARLTELTSEGKLQLEAIINHSSDLLQHIYFE